MLLLRRTLLGAAAAVPASLLAGRPSARAASQGKDGGQGGSGTPAPMFGAALPLSGGFALAGDEVWRGIQLAAEAVNAAGGIAGQSVSLAVADAPDQPGATAAVNQLLSAHANILFGSGSSSLSYPASAAAELAQMPFIELTAPADGIMTRGFKFLRRFAPTTAMIGQLAAATLQQRFAGRTLGLLFNTGATGGAIAAAVLAALKAANLNVKLVIGYPEDVADLYEPAGRLMRAKIDVLVHAAGPDDALALFQALPTLGWRPAALLGCGAGYGLRDTQIALGEGLNGTFYIGAPFYPAAAQGVAQAYAARYGVPPRGAESCTAYAGAKLVFDTLNTVGGDPGQLLAALGKLALAKGALVNGFGAAFDRTGQNSNAFVTLQAWDKGRLLPA